MKVTRIDRQTCTVLRGEIDAALAAVAQKYGVKISAGSARFTDATVDFKVQVAVIAANGQVASREAQTFKLYAASMGFAETDLGRSFTVRGQQYTLSGYNAKARSMPFLATRADGKTFKFTLDAVRDALGIQVKPTVIMMTSADLKTDPRYTQALAEAQDMLCGAHDSLSARDALKQAGSDAGIPYGEEMGRFVAWAEPQMR